MIFYGLTLDIERAMSMRQAEREADIEINT